MKKTITTQLSGSNIAQAITLLAGTPARLENLSQGMNAQQLQLPLRPGERSFHGVLVHLLNVEARFPEAIYLAIHADEPLFVNIHPERELGKLLRYDQFAFSDLLDYFRLRRLLIMPVITQLTEEQWSRVIREDGKSRKESIYWRVRSQALHEQEHLQDLESKLSFA